MRIVKNDSDNKDKLEELFRKQLRNAEVAPPAMAWDKLEANLDTEREKIKYDHWYYAVLILLFPFTITNMVVNYNIKDVYHKFLQEKHREESYGPTYNLVGAFPSQLRHVDHAADRTINQPLSTNFVEGATYQDAAPAASYNKQLSVPFIASNQLVASIAPEKKAYHVFDDGHRLFGNRNLDMQDGLALQSDLDKETGYLSDRDELGIVTPNGIVSDNGITLPSGPKRFKRYIANRNSPLSIPKVQGFYFGFLATGDQNRLFLRQSTYLPLVDKGTDYRSRWGYSYGIRAGYNFNTHWGVEADYVFSSVQKMSYNDLLYGKIPVNGEIALSYFQVPVVAKYKFSKVSRLTGQPVSVNLLAGIMYSHLKQASINSNEGSLPDAKQFFSENDLGLMVGAEYDVFINKYIFFTIGARGSVSTDLNVGNTINPKNNNYYLQVGVNAGFNIQLPTRKREPMKIDFMDPL